jgi:5'-methylthioadenosine phosphorylase
MNGDLTERASRETAATIAVIGGSGLYTLFDADRQRTVTVPTPFGTSVAVTRGRLGGRDVAFVPRHGSDHSVPPHRIDSRATTWALASLGVRTIVSTAAVGSLDPALPIGSVVLADQLVERTHGRHDTFFDDTVVRHLPFADPFAPALREIALRACPELVDGGTVLVIQGPRFSTRAESRINRSLGIHLVNMTLYPETALAAELGIDTIALCVVTDVDSGESAADAVTADMVFARLAEARPRLVTALERIVAAVPHDYAPRTLIDADAVSGVLRTDAG